MEKNILVENEQHFINTIIHFITKRDENSVIRNKLIDDYSKKKVVYEDWDVEAKDSSDRNLSG